MMLSSPTRAFFLTQIHQVINLKESEKAVFWKRIWKRIWEGMMFWKHTALCKDCSSYFSSSVLTYVHPSLCLYWKMFRLSQNFLCTKSSYIMVTCLQRELNLSCFVFFRLYLFPVWLFLCTFFISWFVSSASASPMWPSSVVFIQEQQHFGL